MYTKLGHDESYSNHPYDPLKLVITFIECLYIYTIVSKLLSTISHVQQNLKTERPTKPINNTKCGHSFHHPETNTQLW
jgi:hypothetical protein